MKTVLPLLLSLLMFSSCFTFTETDSDIDSEIGDYTPILMKRSALEESIRFEEGRPLISPAKIFLKGNYIYMTEKYKGVHVIDNSDPTNPKSVAFIQVPGCLDVAVKENVLYADNSTDLVAIDINDLANMQVLKRVPNIFPEPTPPGQPWIPDAFLPENRPDKDMVIVEWVKK